MVSLGDGINPQHMRFTMYVKAEIVRVATATDKCVCGGTMGTTTTEVAQAQ